MGLSIGGVKMAEPVVEASGEEIKESPKEKKLSELNQVLAQLRKEKPGLVVEANTIPNVERIPTGVWEFDDATGGGFPMGRYSIVYGPESSGKTNLCYKAVANAQRRPAPCNKVVWIDLEGTFDPTWAALFGVDVDELILIKPAYGEEAVDAMDAVVRAEDVALVVLDSLAVVTSTKELEQSVEKFDVGTASILIKRMCNKIVIGQTIEARRGHHPAVILVNQTRFKIGVMFGDPETMPGGNTMKFLSSLTVRLYGVKEVDKKINPDMPAYNATTMVVKKSKIAVNAVKAEYKMVLVPHDGMVVGDSNSWNNVKGQLQHYGVLTKTNKGWELFGHSSPTLAVFQDTYMGEPEFAVKCQQAIIASKKGQAFLIEAEGAAK
jgi:recombination protein RecA